MVTTNQSQLKQMAQMQSSLFNRAKEMSQGRTTSELEQIARNICTEKGISYEDALSQFKSIWG